LIVRAILVKSLGRMVDGSHRETMSISRSLNKKRHFKMSVGTNNQHSVSANDVRDALENSWAWFLVALEENEIEDEFFVKRLVQRVLDLVEEELAE